MQLDLALILILSERGFELVAWRVGQMQALQ